MGDCASLNSYALPHGAPLESSTVGPEGSLRIAHAETTCVATSAMSPLRESTQQLPSFRGRSCRSVSGRVLSRPLSRLSCSRLFSGIPFSASLTLKCQDVRVFLGVSFSNALSIGTHVLVLPGVVIWIAQPPCPLFCVCLVGHCRC
jgi:hypothetical protein